MKQVIHNLWITWTIRCSLIGLLVIWIVLFAVGWASTRPELEQVIEGRSLYAWDHDLFGFSSSDSPTATAVLRRHYTEIMPTVLDWAHRREKPAASVYFFTIGLFIGKHTSPYEYGIGAHSYRGAAARILGALGPIDARVLPTLKEIRDDPNNFDYERQIAERGLDRIANAASSDR